MCDPQRVQLDEMLGLLQWCEQYEPCPAGPAQQDLSRTTDRLYKVENFPRLLSHHDERLHERLDQEFMQKEWAFAMKKRGGQQQATDSMTKRSGGASAGGLGEAPVRSAAARRQRTKGLSKNYMLYFGCM